jgi:3-phenylpropionate/trans-cinnamate dioxygenase ferredoxin reductase subunit
MERTRCRVTAVRELGSEAVALVLESPPGFSAQPGQFVKLTFEAGEEVARFYTISSPTVEDTFELTIEIDPEGELGPDLAAVTAGDELLVSGPFGRDYYAGEAAVVVLAGGPGVGPAVGIAERVIEDGGEVAVVYRDATPIHTDRLAAIEEAGGSVAVLVPEESLDESVRAALDATGASAQLFVYGFAAFIDDATAAIEAAGADAGEAKIENFG